MLRDNNRLSLFMISLVLEHLFERLPMWLCQFNLSLKLSSMKLNSSTQFIFVLSIFICCGFIILELCRLCGSPVFLTWLRCAITFLFAFILALHATKTFTICCSVQHSDVNMIQRDI